MFQFHWQPVFFSAGWLTIFNLLSCGWPTSRAGFWPATTRKTMTKKLEIATSPQNVANNPLALIQQAVDKGASIEVLERMFTLQERWEKNQAKKAYDLAISQAQAEFPEIKKTKSVPTRSGQIAYRYAPIEQVVKQVKGVLAKYNLSYSIKTEVGEGKVKSICFIRHIDGHSEQSEMEVPLGNKTDVMSNSQVVAAASTFSKRYAFMNALGIMTGDDDNEQALKADEDKTKETIEKLEKCTQDNQVVELWKGFSKELRANPDVVAKTAEMRKLIRDAKNQEVKDSKQ